MSPAAYVKLDLQAAQHNLRQVRCYAPNNKVMAVIKANAYGHGILRLANALNEADGFAVARVDEGVRLRQAGFQQAILVLQGFVCQDELQLMLNNQLDAMIHNVTQIEILKQLSPQTAQLKVWLKMDTGMNRLGFKVDDFQAAYQQLSQLATMPMLTICWMTKPDSNSIYSIKVSRDFPGNEVLPIQLALSAGPIFTATG